MTKTRPMTDKQLFDLIGAVDPFVADAQPTDVDTDAALRVLLASGPPLDASPRTQRTNVRHPRRVALRAGIGVASVGAIAFGVVNVLPSDGPDHIATASAHAVIRRALDAITPTAGSVLHVEISGSQTNPDGTMVTWEDQSWQQDSAPYNGRQIETGQGTSVELATVNGTDQLYDPATNTVYERSAPHYDLTPGPTAGTYELRVAPPTTTDLSGTSQQKANVQRATEQFPTTPVTITITADQAQALRDGTATVGWTIHWRRPATATAPTPEVVSDNSEIGGPTAQAFHAQAVKLMKSSGVQVDAHTSVDGQPAIKIASTHGQQVYYVTPDTYQPIELDTTGQGGSTTLRFSVYQEVTGAQANATQLSLPAVHPSAKVDKSAADYQAAENRLFPNG